MLFEVRGKTCLDERADPFMRRDGDVRGVPHRMGLQQVQSVRVKACGVGFDEVDLNTGLRPGGFEHAVQLVGSSNNVACPQRAGAIGARPQIDCDCF